MRTEITIPFAFDTTPIEQMLEKVGEEEVTKKVDEIVERCVLESIPKAYTGWGSTGGPDWKTFVERRIDAFIADNADKIVNEAAVLLAMRGGRKKAWKDVLEEYKREMS